MLATFTETSRFHDLSPFVSATFMICVNDFPHGEVLVKVGIMKFGFKLAQHAYEKRTNAEVCVDAGVSCSAC